jgi:hypothetical protein
MVTVERIWEKIPSLDICYFSTKRWHRMCFSFSLFKLMRCRFEHYPMVEEFLLRTLWRCKPLNKLGLVMPKKNVHGEDPWDQKCPGEGHFHCEGF